MVQKTPDIGPTQTPDIEPTHRSHRSCACWFSPHYTWSRAIPSTTRGVTWGARFSGELADVITYLLLAFFSRYVHTWSSNFLPLICSNLFQVNFISCSAYWCWITPCRLIWCWIDGMMTDSAFFAVIGCFHIYYSSTAVAAAAVVNHVGLRCLASLRCVFLRMNK